MENFFDHQKKRINLLKMMINNFNDGRSRSFYCIATTLLPIVSLERALDNANQKIKTDDVSSDDIKTKTKILRKILDNVAVKEGFDLKLKKPSKKKIP
jgi:hypothetical protein